MIRNIYTNSDLDYIEIVKNKIDIKAASASGCTILFNFLTHLSAENYVTMRLDPF